MKKGERIPCLGCKGTGIILGPGNKVRPCQGCNGKGYIIV